MYACSLLHCFLHRLPLTTIKNSESTPETCSVISENYLLKLIKIVRLVTLLVCSGSPSPAPQSLSSICFLFSVTSSPSIPKSLKWVYFHFLLSIELICPRRHYLHLQTIKTLQRVSSWWEMKGGVGSLKEWAMLKAENQLDRQFISVGENTYFQLLSCAGKGTVAPCEGVPWGTVHCASSGKHEGRGSMSSDSGTMSTRLLPEWLIQPLG